MCERDKVIVIKVFRKSEIYLKKARKISFNERLESQSDSR